MIAAHVPVQRPDDARLLVVDGCGRIGHHWRSHLPTLLRPGDVLIANDAATLPASLDGIHVPTDQPIEVRLVAHAAGALAQGRHFTALVFGEGDFRTPTERRAAPPALAAGDVLRIGPLRAAIEKLLDHPRIITLNFEGSRSEIWEGLARHGRPIQYAHIPSPLAIWDVWTPIAALPVSFEPPSASFVLDWKTLRHCVPAAFASPRSHMPPGSPRRGISSLTPGFRSMSATAFRK